ARHLDRCRQITPRPRAPRVPRHVRDAVRAPLGGRMKDDILEKNVSTLLEQGGEPPRMAEAARARIRAELVAKLGVADVPRTRARTRVMAALVGVAAAIALAIVAARFFRGGSDSGGVAKSDGALADGSTFVTAPGGKVTVLGTRHVRVEGEALLDV